MRPSPRSIPLRPLLALALCACAPTPSTGPTDAGAPDDASVAAVDLSALPADAWSYVPFPGTACGNGSPAVIGVNPHPGASSVLFVVSGGGACWDAESCLRTDAAVHVREDYTRAMLDAEVGPIHAVGWDVRTAAQNPFRDAHLVYVPYCTGDLHAGDAVQAYDPAQPDRLVHHAGGRNMRTFLAALARAWPALTTVRAIGFSAGGYGVQLNWGHLAEAWPSASLSLLADCAPLVEIDAPLYSVFRASWNMDTPADCTACATSFPAYDDFFAAAHPGTRFGLVATTRDRVLTGYFGVPDMPARVDALLRGHLDDDPTTRYFVVDSEEHVLFGSALTTRASDGTLLFDWLVGWLGDGAAYHSVRP